MSNVQLNADAAVWFNNRTGNHNVLDKHTRPVCNLAITDNGSTGYISLFASKQVQVKFGKTHTTIRIPNNLVQPVLRSPMKKGATS